MEASGVMARAFAHEIDHLDGMLFIDRIGMVKRNLLRNKLNAIRKKAKEMARFAAMRIVFAGSPAFAVPSLKRSA